MWQYNLNGAHGKTIKDVDILYSATNPAGTDNCLGALRFFHLQRRRSESDSRRHIYAALFTARYIKLDINSS